MPDIEGPYTVPAPLDLTTLPAQLAEARARGDGLAADLATCMRLRDQALAEVEKLQCKVNRVSVWMDEMAELADDPTRWDELAAAVRSAVHAV